MIVLDYTVQKLYEIGADVYTPALGEREQDYENPGLYRIFRQLAYLSFDLKGESIEKRESIIYRQFNLLIAANVNDFGSEQSFCYWKLKDFKELDLNFFSSLFLNSVQEEHGKQLIKQFNFSYKKVRGEGTGKQDRFFRQDDVERYLDAYLDLCRFIFDVGGIFQDEIRKSKIVQNILNIEYNEAGKYFTFTSPFAMFSILRTMNYIIRMSDEDIMPSELDEYTFSLNRRAHMLATYAMHSFTRFTIINEHSYVINYSRRGGNLICKDADECSSIENVKPIRLLEKIISHLVNIIDSKIHQHPKGMGELEFTVSVMGFCSSKKQDNSEDVREVIDLIFEIFSWFEDVKNKGADDSEFYKNTKLKLNLNYFKSISETDSVEKDFVYITNNNYEIGKCHLSIKSIRKNIESNTLKDTYANNIEKSIRVYLKDAIKDSDIVFLLDCPWLAIEDFYSINHGDIFTYTKWLHDVSYKKDLYRDSLGENAERFSFSKDHLLYSINDQLNRIAVDNFVKYGKIARVPKKYLLDWILKEMDTYKNKSVYKTVYLYSSSVSGMRLSDYVNYPIIRQETYNNKTFSIMRLSSRESSVLKREKDNEKATIMIDLWSFLKYVDISFVLLAMKEYFANNFYEIADTKEDANALEKKMAIKRDIISICRSTIFEISSPKINFAGETKIDVHVLIYDPVYSKFQNNFAHKQAVEALMRFFENIIKNVIFSDNQGFGDNSIRDAFESCLYSKSNSVDDLFLLYDYQTKRKAKKLNTNLVDFNLELKNKKDYNVSSFDAFSDKRIYNKLFEYLSLPSPPKHLIYECMRTADNLYPASYGDSHARQMLTNIIELCDSCGSQESNLMKNAKIFLNGIN